MAKDKVSYQDAVLQQVSGTSRWAGVATVNSGDSTVVVAATAANSGAAIGVSLGVTTVASHRDLVTSINSVTDDTGFIAVLDKAVISPQEVVFTVVRLT